SGLVEVAGAMLKGCFQSIAELAARNFLQHCLGLEVVASGSAPERVGSDVEMTAECGGTTPLNGPQHFDMLPTEPVGVSFAESLSCSADDIGHLQRRPTHLFLADWLVVDR